MQTRFGEMKLTGKLPSPSGVGMAILKLTQNEDHATEELTRTIQTDPAISGRIIKMANTACCSGVEAVTTIEEAAVRLGVKCVRNVALGFSLVSNHRQGTCASFDYDRFWSESLLRAVASQALARAARLGDPSEAYICGLFSGIGMLALASVHQQGYSRVLKAAGQQGSQALARMEKRAFEISHYEVAADMLQDWGLPEAYGDAILWCANPRAAMGNMDKRTGQLAQALLFGKSLGRTALLGEKAHGGHWLELKEILSALHVAQENPAAFCESIKEDWVSWGQTLAIPTYPSPTFDEIAERPKAETGSEIMGSLEVAQAGDGLPIQQQIRPQEADQKIRILAVDDDLVTLRILAFHLRKAGYKVLTAKDGESALKTALEQDPHVVVSDWQMPKMDGLQLCQALRRFAAGARMHFILLTCQDEEERIVEAFDAGVDDYVSKPFRPRLLLARVKAGMRVMELQVQVEQDKLKMEQQVAELGILNRKLQLASLTDPLTGLPNRRHAMQALHDTWQQAQQKQHCLSVLMLDIDFFKKVNDSFGHDAGDEVLRQTTAIFQQVCRQHECVYRIGGEEFLVICPNADLKQALACGERIRETVEEHLIMWKNFEGRVTVSIGAAQSHPAMQHPEELLKASDKAVYAAKEGGRNRVAAAPLPVSA